MRVRQPKKKRGGAPRQAEPGAAHQPAPPLCARVSPRLCAPSLLARPLVLSSSLSRSLSLPALSRHLPTLGQRFHDMRLCGAHMPAAVNARAAREVERRKGRKRQRGRERASPAAARSCGFASSLELDESVARDPGDTPLPLAAAQPQCPAFPLMLAADARARLPPTPLPSPTTLPSSSPQEVTEEELDA